MRVYIYYMVYKAKTLQYRCIPILKHICIDVLSYYNISIFSLLYYNKTAPSSQIMR